MSRPLLNLLVSKAFADRNVMRVELNVYEFNTAAIQSYRAFGFTREGVRRSSARFADERWNTVMMGLLRAEWVHSGSNAAQKG
nr:GNAT family protein [Marinicella sp. W31]MDC2879074.1 GNAT family protein [Marinicella sp. W31]